MARHAIVELPAASGQLVNVSGCLLAHATMETTGISTAAYDLYDGSGTGGLLLVPVSLSANESTRDSWRHGVYPFRQGLYYNLASGTVQGSVSVLLEHDDEVFWAAVYQALYGQG